MCFQAKGMAKMEFPAKNPGSQAKATTCNQLLCITCFFGGFAALAGTFRFIEGICCLILTTYSTDFTDCIPTENLEFAITCVIYVYFFLYGVFFVNVMVLPYKY